MTAKPPPRPPPAEGVHATALTRYARGAGASVQFVHADGRPFPFVFTYTDVGDRCVRPPCQADGGLARCGDGDQCQRLEKP